MKTPPLELRLSGTVTPPADMVECAKKSLGDDYPDFVAKFPGEITPAKLVSYIEESTDGPRS